MSTKEHGRIWMNRSQEAIGNTGIIMGMGSDNERQRHIVTSSLIDWAHSQDDPLKYNIATTNPKLLYKYVRIYICHTKRLYIALINKHIARGFVIKMKPNTQCFTTLPYIYIGNNAINGFKGIQYVVTAVQYFPYPTILCILNDINVLIRS